MKLQAHLSNNMGVRASSADALFPYTIMAKGNPHEPDGIHWFVRSPDGTLAPPDGFSSAGHAYNYGMAWKASNGAAPKIGQCWVCGGPSPTGKAKDCPKCGDVEF